ncbi:MAG: FGGY family carbohydrate kinase [Candidatus Saganbacteria bacterium]|nr:FGGY family carbohydrate kinase [Candidatus Saganbacteria bacterium]
MATPLIRNIRLTAPVVLPKTAPSAMHGEQRPERLLIIGDLGASGTGRWLTVEVHNADGQLSFVQKERVATFPFTVTDHMIDKAGLLKGFSESLFDVSRRYDRSIPRTIAVNTFGAGFEILNGDGSIHTPLTMYTHPGQSAGAQYIADMIAGGDLEKAFKMIHSQSAGQGWQTVYNLFHLAAISISGHKIPSDARIFGTPDVLNHFLTGVHATEESFARVFNCAKRDGLRWNQQLLDTLDIPVSAFPMILPTGTSMGDVRPEILNDMGCDKAEVVLAGLHDTAGAVAALKYLSTGNNVFISTGTWSLVCSLIDAVGLEDETIKILYKHKIGVEGGTAATFGVMNVMGTMLIDSLLAELGLKDQTDRFKRLFAGVHNPDTGAAVIDIMSPKFLYRQGGPVISPVKQFCSDTGQEAPTTQAEIVKSVVLGMVLAMGKAVGQNAALTNELYGRTPDGIIVGGGLINDRMMLQALANVTQMNVTTTFQALAPIGNAATLLIGSGYESDQVMDMLEKGSENITYCPTNDKGPWADLVKAHAASK